ncbi:MAG: ABC transporter permease [Acidobacteria bacterium]|nr:ABC transporter permease [Acidobacteriota bacterium]
MIKRWLSHPLVDLALKALGRNRLQTGLTLLGMTIGVATVLAMMAVGAGAQRAIEQQVRAAGLNQLTVRAGNFRPKVEDTGEAIAHQGDARDTLTLPIDLEPALDESRFHAQGKPDPDLSASRLPHALSEAPRPGSGRVEGPPASRHALPSDAVPAAFHPEDDPMEKHDHPLARQRLGDLEAGLGSAATLSFADAMAIKDLSGVQYVAGGIHENARVHAGSKRWFTRMHGTDTEMPSIKRGWLFTEGRFFSAREQDRAEQVMVLGQIVAEKLFGAGVSAIGQQVSIWNQPFTVVGVVSSATWVVRPAPGDDQFDAVYMPYTTTHRLLNLSKLNDVTVTAASSGDVTRLAREITTLLRQRHGIGDDQPDDFTVSTQATKALTTGGLPPSVARAVAGNVSELERVTLEQLATTLERASRTMTWLLAAVAAVSLIVGGIGIMNITLLSVTERTREIGLRLAVGARGRDVMRQFLAEAVAISLAGGVAGIILGVIAAALIARTLNWATVVSPLSVLLAFGVAGAVGIFFGWYPARRAAQLDPIVALRRE